MKEHLTIDMVEERIEHLEKLLSHPQNMPLWSKLISQYNALKIKWNQMKGIKPIVSYYKPDHII